MELVEEMAAPLLRANTGIGVVIGIIKNDERHLYSYGRIHSEKPDPPSGTTLYEIGSITKVFTALLLAALVVDEQLSLDTPVHTWLPEVSSFPAQIQLRHLATHTSGLPRLPGNLRHSLLKNPRDPYANYTEADLLSYLRQVGEGTIAKHFGKINYSNLGMGLLGWLLARRLGTSYEEAIAKYICQPLGLVDTRILPSEDQHERAAQPHTGTGKPTNHMHMPTLQGAGALFSTAQDMLSVIRAHIDPKSSLHDAIRLCLTLQCRDYATPGRYERLLSWLGRRFQKPKPEPEPYGIGFGWLAAKLPTSGEFMWGHSGGTVGFRSFAAFAPSRKVGVIVLYNRGWSELELIIPKPSVEDIGLAVMEYLTRH